MDFTGDWDGPNMLWVEKDAQGQTVFHLEQAFAWQGPGQKVQWVLVEPSPDADKDGPLASERDWWDMVSNRLLPERIVIDTPPKARLADGEVGSVYARRSTKTPAAERSTRWACCRRAISAPRSTSMQRTLYLWRRKDGQWRLLGEGPATEMGKLSGNEGYGSSVEAKVRWIGDEAAPSVELHVTEGQSDAGTEDRPALPTVNWCNDYCSEPPAGTRSAACGGSMSGPTCLTQKGNTLAAVAKRFSPGSGITVGRRRKRLRRRPSAKPSGWRITGADARA